jgi:hypothetical protein
MKQKDIILIVGIVIVSAIFSLFISKLIFGSAAELQQKAEVVQPISSAFAEPDKAYFNKDSIDPAKLITVSPNDNPNPFKSTSPNGQ